MMSTLENKDMAPHIDINLLERTMTKATRPETKQVFKPKTNLPAMPNSVRAKGPRESSQIINERWPQATMVIMGGNECQVLNTEVLKVSTTKNNFNEEANEKRSNEEVRVTLPDIHSNNRANQAEESGQIPSRFAARSPSKLSQLPAFSKNLLNQSKDKQSKDKDNRLIKSIKFWRGTTPVANYSEKEKTKEKSNEDTNTSESLSKNDSILQNWNEQISIFEESSKNKYFSWQMALRNRLFKHERMYYQEAVSRINKYRQQLKTKPAFKLGSRELPPNMDAQLWKNLIQQHSVKKTIANSNKPAEVSMSPTQEWKPYIPNEKGKRQRKPPYVGNSNSDSRKRVAKANDGPPPTSPTKRTTLKSETELKDSTYPVHGEALLKDEGNKPKANQQEVTTSSPEQKQENEENELKAAESSENEDEKSSTRALLVGLKNQLTAKGQTEHQKEEKKEVISRNDSGLAQTKGLGLKLKLLLQNGSQSQQNRNNRSEDTRQANTARKNPRSRLQSQQGGYRPISRPRTIGDSSLPKIHNIMTSSLWKRHGGNKDEARNTGTKHRLTLAGVANREIFSSSVIGIAQKHIIKRPKAVESTNEQQNHEYAETETNETRKENPAALVGSNTDAAAMQNKETNQSNIAQADSAKAKKKKNPAYRLYTPATIHQHQFSSTTSLSKIQEKENPQYKSLKLVTALTEKQKSPPTTPLEQFRARQQALKGKHKTKTGAKHKVLRVSVVEPPLTAKERYERQQEAEKSRKRLTFNPTHAALRNLSTAILNSELDLRAPSSSPVDMFHGQHYNLRGEHELPDYSGLQKPADSIHSGVKPSDSVHHLHYKGTVPINQMDGLTPPRPAVQIEGYKLNSVHGNTTAKPSTAPKLKDLINLQKMYNVMKKHGEAYTNGSAYFYSPTPNVGLDANTKQQTTKNSNKIPFYYYPYQGDTNIQALNQNEGAPLYVVTGANSMATSRNLGHVQRTKKKVSYAPYVDAHMEETDPVSTVPYRHVLSLSKSHHLTQWNTEDESKHALTVVMPKTPGISMPTTLSVKQLEQIQEHVMQ